MCIRDSLKTLSIIQKSSLKKTAAELYDALKSNMVVPMNDSYKFIGLDSLAESDFAAIDTHELNPTYKFQHDRVQQAAYSRISPEKRQALHLSIGRLILNHSTKVELDEKLMDVVGHLNEGRELIEDLIERKELVRLNLAAGIKAKQSSAYESTLAYLKIGHEILGEEAWQNDYDLSLIHISEPTRPY